jgi:signal transduction histidine kinase
LLDVLSPRLAVRQRPGEMIEVERLLAVARAMLAVTSLAALKLYPTESFPATSPVLSVLLCGLVLLYAGHAVALLVLLWRWNEVPARFSWTVQTADILWPCLISVFLFSNGPVTPFFLYFIFAVLAAAFRWGMREALLTMVVAIVAMAGEAFAVNHATVEHAWGNHALGNHVWFAVPAGPGRGVLITMRIVYLIIFGLLIGQLTESEKRRRAEASSIFQISSKARVDAGLKSTLQAVMQEMLKLFQGRELLLLTREAGAGGAHLWRVATIENGGEINFSWRSLDNAQARPYLFELPAQGEGTAWLGGNPLNAITIGRDGKRLRGSGCCLSQEFVSRHSFDKLLTSSVLFAPDLSCRIFLFEPRAGGRPRTQLRFLRDLTNRVAPAIYNVYLLRRLRSRAAAAERSRIARDLHDGVVQSLHALAFRLYALRTGTRMDERERTQELLDLQELIQKEAAGLRSMIQHLQPVELDPAQLVDFLSGMIERYRYDTGIAAKFVCDVGKMSMPPATSREVVGIVQEALANILKHSGAENVLVHLAAQEGTWILTIEDDGRGFEFSGRLTQLELERIRRGPLIIKQRARAIGAELTVESRPGQGARLEIRLPQPVQEHIAQDIA